MIGFLIAFTQNMIEWIYMMRTNFSYACSDPGLMQGVVKGLGVIYHVTDNCFWITYYYEELYTQFISHFEPMPQCVSFCPVIGGNAKTPWIISSWCPSGIWDDLFHTCHLRKVWTMLCIMGSCLLSFILCCSFQGVCAIWSAFNKVGHQGTITSYILAFMDQEISVFFQEMSTWMVWYFSKRLPQWIVVQALLAFGCFVYY